VTAGIILKVVITATRRVILLSYSELVFICRSIIESRFSLVFSAVSLRYVASSVANYLVNGTNILLSGFISIDSRISRVSCEVSDGDLLFQFHTYHLNK
jgi:hypothetical protein